VERLGRKTERLLVAPRHARHASLVLAAVLVALVLGATAACQRSAPSFKAIDVTGAEFGRSFNLPDADGTPRSLTDFKGRMVLLFFGFTQCPDVCPSALSRAVELRKQLGSDGDKVQVVFITVDPERDTPELLRQYMRAFDPSFVALRGDAQALADTAKEFKVFFQKVPTSGSYTMDHTALTYVFDPDGRLRLALRHEQPMPDVVADLKALLRE
jgi:protein SCO1/2